MRVPMRGEGTEQPVVAKKSGKPDGAKGLRHSALWLSQPKSGKSLNNKAKSFSISKWAVFKAYKQVKANRGASGVDRESIEEFEKNLKDNLYKIWNRMSSGSYFPPPVRTVEIPKKDGKTRQLGIPTVADRIAQTVLKLYLEPIVEPHFHPDSYGYRPGKSAHDALATTRERCWRHDWAIDLDIKGFFDNLNHELVMRAVGKYTDSPWMLLYVERWLKAPSQMEDGEQIPRDKGTPQGGVASPLLANIFLNLAFDEWMKKTHPGAPFERYADDIVVHCQTKEEAKATLSSIEKRLAQCKLSLHPGKTKIVYCKDGNRMGNHIHEKFDFLGYTFRPRRAKNKRGEFFISFLPAISNDAAKKMRQVMRSWRLHRRSDKNIEDLAYVWNPVLRGWIQYYGKFYRSALYPIFQHLNKILARWASRKYKRLTRHKTRATHWLGRIARREPRLFAHWDLLGLKPAAG